MISSPSPPSRSGPSQSSNVAKKHNGNINFDDFMCKKGANITTDHDNTYSSQQNLQPPTSSAVNKRQIDNASLSVDDFKHQKTAHSSNDGMFDKNSRDANDNAKTFMWNDQNENKYNQHTNTNTNTKVDNFTNSLSISNMNNINMKLKGFDTSEITNDDDW